MKILLTGINGQLGHELQHTLAPLGEVVGAGRTTMDLTQPDQILRVIDAVQPDLIVNPAAYTAVDRAETEPELGLRDQCDRSPNHCPSCPTPPSASHSRFYRLCV